MLCIMNHGCPSFGFSFEMRKFTRSIYHKKVKFINKREQKLKKQAITTFFINNNSRDFWSEISKIRKKTQNNKCLVEADPGMSLNCAPTRVCRKSASRPGYVVKVRPDPGMS